MNTIKKEAFNLIKEYQQKLSDYSPSPIGEKPYNFEISVQLSTDKIKVQVYFGKKGVKTVLQGNPNSAFYNEIESRLFDQQKLGFNKPAIIENEPDEYIGADESGKGDFFGPLVTAAVFAEKEDLANLKSVGAVDSKLLNDNQILKIAEEIKSILKTKFIVTSLVPKNYNKVYSEKMNLNKLLREEHQANIQFLLRKYKTENIIIDSFEKKAFTIEGKVKIFQTEKAERFTGVAAASILARAGMVLWFENNLFENEIKLPKGSSMEVNNFLKKYAHSLDTNWANFCKLHFKNFQNIKMLMYK